MLPLFSTTMTTTAVFATGIATILAAFSRMDANPALFVFDKFLVSKRRQDEFFRGKTMWITGASSGIGAQLAKQLSTCEGLNLILSARPSERLDSVAESCRRNASKCGNATITVVPVDLTLSESTLEGAVDTVLKHTKGNHLDYVVLNAGTGQLRPASITNHSNTEQIFQVNTLAPIALTRILLEKKGLHKDGGKHIVVTSSVGAKMGVPLSASYAASKHALHGYFNSLTAELPWLRVDLVCPGTTDTEFHHKNGKGIPSSETTESKEVGGTTKKLKMPVERCTSLLISCMMMKHGGEFWIAEQPVLLGFYINQHFPGLFQEILRKMGPLRIRAWEEGRDLYDPQTWKNMKSQSKRRRDGTKDRTD